MTETVKKGKFIVVEGLDGSGKSTQLRNIHNYIESLGFDVVLTKEPQDNRPTGELIRRVLKGTDKASPEYICAMFAADRLDHITYEDGILNSLNHGKFVICDRYYLSNYAYNCVDVDLDWIISINSMAASMAKPDVHIYIDVPPEIAMQRISARGEKELYETNERLTKVYNNYNKVFEILKDREKIIKIDGTKDIQTVFAQVKDCLNELINN